MIRGAMLGLALYTFAACSCTSPPVVRVCTGQTPDPAPIPVQGAECKHAGPVVFNYAGLTPRGFLSQADIDREVASAMQDVRKHCGINLKATRNPLAGGNIRTTWGSRSAHWRPCDQLPATGTFQASIADTNLPGGKANSVYIFGFLLRHESFGHGLGIDHGGTGLMGVGLQDPSHPYDYDPWMVAQLQQRYGKPARPPRKPIAKGWYLVLDHQIKRGTTPAAVNQIPPMRNTRYVAGQRSHVRPGVYWAKPRGESDGVPVHVDEAGTVWRLRRNNGPAATTVGDYRAWFGPVRGP